MDRCVGIREILCGGWCGRTEFSLIDRMASQFAHNYKTGFFLIILTFNLELDTRFFGGVSNNCFESFYIFYWHLRLNFPVCAL